MAKAKKAAARKAAAVKPAVSALVQSQVAGLRARAAVERHGGTALELRLQAVEKLLEALTA